MTIRTAADAVRAGIGYLSEDRKQFGVLLDQDVKANTAMAAMKDFHIGGFILDGKIKTVGTEYSQKLRVKTPTVTQLRGKLSGGNQQKVVIGKMLATNPKVLLLDEPSRGIDIGAKAEVFRLVAERARQGLAVIYSTSEVGECLSVAHRIIVMRRGKISAEFGPDASKEQIMAASGEAVIV